MTTIDFMKALQDAKGASYEALPVGDYDVEIVESNAVRASSGKPMIKVQARVLQGPHADRRIFNNFVLSLENPQAMAIFFRHMRCFGLNDEFFASLGASGGLDPVASALLGRRARWSLGIRQWQGEDRNEVNQVKPYTGAPALAGPGGASPPPVVGPTPVVAPVAPSAPPVAPPTPAPVVQPVPPVVAPAAFAVPTEPGSEASTPSYPIPPTSETTPPPPPPPAPLAPDLPI